MTRRLLILLLLLLLLVPLHAGAYGEDSILRDKASGVTLQAPYDWVLHKQTGYPDLRGLLVHRLGDATIALMVGHLAPGQSLEAYVKSNCRAMARVGIKVTRCGTLERGRATWRRVDGVSDQGRKRLEQYYRTSGGQAIILSLTSASKVAAARSADLWRVQDALTVTPRNTEPPRNDATRGVQTAPNEAPAGKASPGKQEEPLPELPGGELESEPELEK